MVAVDDGAVEFEPENENNDLSYNKTSQISGKCLGQTSLKNLLSPIKDTAYTSNLVSLHWSYRVSLQDPLS